MFGGRLIESLMSNFVYIQSIVCDYSVQIYADDDPNGMRALKMKSECV